MAELNIEGELKYLSERQLAFIKDFLEKRGYKNKKVVVKPVGEKGDNYIATVLRITVTENERATFDMIAKVSSSVEIIRTQMNQDAMFANEILMYDEVLPKLNELQLAAGVPESERFRFPACYGTLAERPHEILLLEDLSESGYAIFDRTKPLSEKSINLAVKNLAMFHTLTFALKAKEPQKFDNYKNRLSNLFILMHKKPELEAYFTMLENDILKVLDGDKYKNEVKNVVSQLATISVNLDERLNSSEPKYSVILQGDCWGNNIMFKSDKSEPVSAILIDYQLSREGSPVVDLFYLILNCSTYYTPSERMRQYFDLYYSELSAFLQKFDLDSAVVYPRDKFDSDLKIHAKLGLAQRCTMANVLVREGNDVINVKDESAYDLTDMDKTMEALRITNTNTQTQDKLRKLVSGAIDTLMDLGYL